MEKVHVESRILRHRTIKEFRQKYGLSHAEIAVIVDRSEACVRQWERRGKDIHSMYWRLLDEWAKKEGKRVLAQRDAKKRAKK